MIRVEKGVEGRCYCLGVSIRRGRIIDLSYLLWREQGYYPFVTIMPSCSQAAVVSIYLFLVRLGVVLSQNNGGCPPMSNLAVFAFKLKCQHFKEKLLSSVI